MRIGVLSMAFVVGAVATTEATGRDDRPAEVKPVTVVASVDDVPPIPLQFRRSEEGRPEDGIVLRGAGELAKRLELREMGKAVTPTDTKAVEWATKLLKVEKIDWDKQMLIAINGLRYRFTHEIRIVSLKPDGKNLTVTYEIVQIDGNGLNNPRLLALVPRYEGDVKFVIVAKKKGEEPKELKVVAQRSFVDSLHPISASKADTLIVRSAEELVAASAQGHGAKHPTAQKDPGVQREVEKQFASALKVEKIDWNTQMIVVASTDSGAAGRVNPKVELVSLKASGGKLTLTLANATEGSGGYGRYPGVVAIVERHEGKAEVEWKREK